MVQAAPAFAVHLMELLIVLVIVGLLAALVGPTLYQQIKPAKQSAARADREFRDRAGQLLHRHGTPPDDPGGLNVLRTKPESDEKWKGPYLKKEIPKDPWGNPYVYLSPGRNGGYEIVAYGADGREGGEDDNADITSWENGK
jgi:general secretion pathway protein G